MHLKYRPQTEDQIFGNPELKIVLQNLELDRPILLSGSMGCGKTTIAKILATKFGANEFSIVEQDCENLSQVSDMREELKNLFRSSIFGKKKVLILDEIHGLSPKSLKVLLTPLEKESLLKNTLIIGCTTEINKISEILLSRFLILKVKPLNQTELKQLLNYVCDKEKLKLEKWKKTLLIEKSNGIPRILLKNINIIRNIEVIEEAKYLLELSSLSEIDTEILNLYKLLLSNGDWSNVRPYISKLLTQKSPNSIKIGLKNLIGGRLLSDYFKEAEGGKLKALYSCLDGANNIPEKASLVMSLYKFKGVEVEYR